MKSFLLIFSSLCLSLSVLAKEPEELLKVMFSTVSCEGKVQIVNKDQRENVSLRIYTPKLSGVSQTGNISITRELSAHVDAITNNSSMLIPVEVKKINVSKISASSKRFLTHLEVTKDIDGDKAYLQGRVGSMVFDNLNCHYLQK